MIGTFQETVWHKALTYIWALESDKADFKSQIYHLLAITLVNLFGS